MQGTYRIMNPNEKILIPNGPVGSSPMEVPPAGKMPAGAPSMNGLPPAGGMPAGLLSKERKLVWDGVTCQCQ